MHLTWHVRIVCIAVAYGICRQLFCAWPESSGGFSVCVWVVIVGRRADWGEGAGMPILNPEGTRKECARHMRVGQSA